MVRRSARGAFRVTTACCDERGAWLTMARTHLVKLLGVIAVACEHTLDNAATYNKHGTLNEID